MIQARRRNLRNVRRSLYPVVVLGLSALNSCAAQVGEDEALQEPAALAARIALAEPVAKTSTATPGSTFWYVRTDGGDATQCTGRADAPYPGSGLNRDCAWEHPFVALPPGGDPRIEGGDTLLIGSGRYRLGPGTPGAGDCYATDCHMPPIPSGPSADARTRILGKSCAAPPRLEGTGGASMVVNLDGSSNVEVGCLEITDRSDCVYKHSDPSAACTTDDEWARTGLAGRASSDAWLHDLDIHGMAAQGIRAGGLTDWTVERVKLVANGRSGWDGNIGRNASSNSGTMILRKVEIAWNGCGERWQTGKPWACWAQRTGGYGDGLGTTDTGGQWLVEDAFIHHNTSDGLDLRYMDGARDTIVLVRRLHAKGNAGNQIKIRGNAVIESSVIIGNCGYFSGKYFMTEDDQCRAGGNAIQLVLTPGASATVRHNTIAGEGGVLVGMGEGDDTARVAIHNNILVGFPSFRKPDVLSALHFANRTTAPVHWAGNLVWNVKNGSCPPGSICGEHPRLTNMSLADFDPEPLPGSPAINRLHGARGVVHDFRGVARPVDEKADVGAIETRSR